MTWSLISFSIFKKFYLFIYGCARSSLLCGLFSSCSEQGQLCSCNAWASYCIGFSCCGAQGMFRLQQLGHLGSVVVAPGLSTGSVIVAHKLSCSAACGIFPDQGSNPCLLHWQANSLPLSHQGSPEDTFLSRSGVSNFQAADWYLLSDQRQH